MPRSRIHILYIAEYSTGGSVESLLCLVGGLDKNAFKATVLFYTMPNATMCERFEAAGATALALYPGGSGKGDRRPLQKHNLQGKVRRLAGRHVEHFYESLKFAFHFFRVRRPIVKAIRAKLKEIEPNLVHLNNGIVSDMPGILAARACRVPMVCHIRTFGKLTYPSILAAHSVDRFVCISRGVRDHLTGDGIDPATCIVIPNAVDPVRFNESTNPAAGLRAEFGWDHTHKVFVLAGRVVSWKGQDYFIRAIAEARETDQSIRGLIVGSSEASPSNDSYVSGLKSLVSELGLEDIIRFAGHRTDIPNIMKAADSVVCASSLPEPFGRVIIESMAVGTPAIATNAGGAADIITDGTDGLLVPIKDSAALAQAMLRLSRDDALAQDLRKAAMQSVADHYTVEQHVARVTDVYRSLLAAQQQDSAQ